MKIDWIDLEDAFDPYLRDTRAWFDRETGKTLLFSSDLDQPGEQEALDLIDGDERGRFVRIHRPEDHEELTWMSEFAGTVANAAVRRRLEDALSRSRPFRAFKDELAAAPAERERWFELRQDRLRALIAAWAEEHGITPAVDDRPSWWPT